jgi:hypothetical protein
VVCAASMCWTIMPPIRRPNPSAQSFRYFKISIDVQFEPSWYSFRTDFVERPLLEYNDGLDYMFVWYKFKIPRAHLKLLIVNL